MMGVSYSEDENGLKIFTCITDNEEFVIRDMVEIINGTKNEKGKELGNGEYDITENPFGKVH